MGMEETRDQARDRALAALGDLRRGQSLTAAADSAGTTVPTVLRHVGRAITQLPNGRYEAKPWDRFQRSVRILTASGPERITVKDSRTASKIGRYWNAVDNFVLNGDSEALENFSRKFFQVNGVKHEFLTDLGLIERLAFAGEISFEDLYTEIS